MIEKEKVEICKIDVDIDVVNVVIGVLMGNEIWQKIVNDFDSLYYLLDLSDDIEIEDDYEDDDQWEEEIDVVNVESN